MPQPLLDNLFVISNYRYSEFFFLIFNYNFLPVLQLVSIASPLSWCNQ